MSASAISPFFRQGPLRDFSSFFEGRPEAGSIAQAVRDAGEQSILRPVRTEIPPRRI